MAITYHCPHCGEQYNRLFSINWEKRAKCAKCRRPFEVSPAAFRDNCMVVFAVYSFVPFWLISTILMYVVPLPDPEGIGHLGKIGLGALGGVILACLFMGVGQAFGFFAEPYRREPVAKKPGVKKRRRRERIRCPACGEDTDAQADECEHCGEELPDR